MRRPVPRRPAFLAILVLVSLALPQTVSAARRSRDLGSFPSDYRRILEQYAAGDVDEALEALVGVETDLVERKGEQIVDAMWRSKLAHIRDLLTSGTDVLVPVTVLHEEAYLEYLARGASGLAIHTRTMIIELADYYSDKVSDERRKAVASDLLTSLAADLQVSFMESTAAQLYERALRIQPENVAALLGLAGILERRGDYEEALPHLETLVLLDPEHHEGRLRLGVTLARLERFDEARGVFDRLLSSDPPEWILSLTYQEGARNLANQGLSMAAWDLLEEGVERLPEDPILPIQLAYLSDRATSGMGGFRLDGVLERDASREGTSPRYRYSEPPRTAIAGLRERLRKESTERLPLLARALASARIGRALP